MTEASPDQKLFEFAGELCRRASRNGDGLVLAVTDGYAAANTEIFLHVDAIAAHSPTSTFRSKQLSTMLDESILPTVGVLNPDARDEEAWALKVGYARDRVYAYQKIKTATLNGAPGDTRDVAKTLRDCEDRVMKGLVISGFTSPEEYNTCKRAARTETPMFDREPSLLDNAMATGIDQTEIVVAATGEWGVETEHAIRDSNLGTERFIAFAFPPAEHAALVAANATDGGVHAANGSTSYPAYVTVHNSKGAIEQLPANAVEPHPNSVIVPCAASLICELHSLSAKAGKGHVLIAHVAS
tara:strand:+ start:1659 stop:2555 length:897 start_codon:yes stop_codon:yes gene_type:complete